MTLADVDETLLTMPGQLGGIIRMIEEGRGRSEAVTQPAAASRALNRAGFQDHLAAMCRCMVRDDTGTPPTPNGRLGTVP